MKIDDLIGKLKSIRERRGNIEVIYSYDGLPCFVEDVDVHEEDKENVPGDEFYMPEHVEIGGLEMVWGSKRFKKEQKP